MHFRRMTATCQMSGSMWRHPFARKPATIAAFCVMLQALCMGALRWTNIQFGFEPLCRSAQVVVCRSIKPETIGVAKAMAAANGTSHGAQRIGFLAHLIVGLAVATRTLASCDLPIPHPMDADFKIRHDKLMSQVRVPVCTCPRTIAMYEPA